MSPTLKYDALLGMWKELKKRYEDGYTFRELAAYYGVNVSVVHRHLKRLGVVSRRSAKRSAFGFVVNATRSGS